MSRKLKYKCPCCGHYTSTVSPKDDHGFICPVCFWENDAFINSDTEPSVCNHRKTLQEGRENYKKYGACEFEMLQHVRPPKEDELSGLN